MIGKVAVGLPVGLDQIEPEPLEQRADHRPGHAVAAVDHDPQRLDHARVDEVQGRPLEVLSDVDLLDRPAAGRLAEAGLDLGPDVPDAGVARQRDRASPDELGAGVALGVVRGGAHQPAVELARADQVVEHLGRDLAGVEHGRALAAHALAVGGRELGRAQAHVVAESEPQLGGGLVLELGDHAGEGPADHHGAVGVDLLAVEAADVVGLEDLGVVVAGMASCLHSTRSRGRSAI